MMSSDNGSSLTLTESSPESYALGIGACLLGSAAFGSMFVPIKHLQTGDGLFVQFMMGCAIMCVGVIVQLYEDCPPFYPLVMLGGALWATGNVTAVPIIRSIGMTIGILLWSTSNCMFGWASGRFGWFDTHPQIPKSDLLNSFGLVLALISAVMFACVKSDTELLPAIANSPAPRDSPIRDSLLDNEDGNSIDSVESIDHDNRNVGVNVVGSQHQPQSLARNVCTLFGIGYNARVGGVALSLLAGLFYGLCFMPVVYVQDHPEKYPNASKRGMQYVFAHFTGSFIATVIYFVVYCAFKQNRPYVDRRLAMPAFAAGLIWSVGQTMFFVANEHLSEPVSFPIITRLPGVVAALWSVFYFHEIKGRRNIVLLCWAMLVAVAGSVLCALSKA